MLEPEPELPPMFSPDVMHSRNGRLPDDRPPRIWWLPGYRRAAVQCRMMTLQLMLDGAYRRRICMVVNTWEMSQWVWIGECIRDLEGECDGGVE